MAAAAETRRQDRRRRQRGVETPTQPGEPRIVPGGITPAFFALIIALLSFLPRIQGNFNLMASFWAATIGLLGFFAVVALRTAPADRRLILTTPRKQHYIQAIVQLSVFVYWGNYWQPVYDFAWLLVAQLAFAYGFSMLLTWSRKEAFTLGFGPFPIIFSTNLFLWFRDDWFYLQFLMIALGFLGKEYIKWEREGRRVHIFNPSAFTLGLFSTLLIVTGTTELTWGPEIAATLTLAPNIYLFLFLTGLVVMYFFSITLVAGSAAVTLFGLSALYGSITGVPYFIDSEIPAAVFLGLHLLITDPSTSPRSRPGKAIFGALYGVSVFALYALLGGLGAPTFYDKLMAVPLLNLSVRWIDGVVTRGRASGAWLPHRVSWAPARTNLAHMAVWIAFFAGMAMLGRTDSRHAGDSLPFWEQACEEDLQNGCERLVQITTNYCADNSAWACNQVGLYYRAGTVVEPDPQLALGFFNRACELRFQPACLNVLEPEALASAEPKPLDLRLMLREGGRNLMDLSEPDLLRRACDHQWDFACQRLSFDASSARPPTAASAS